MVEYVVLSRPDFIMSFATGTDAPDSGWGAVIYQLREAKERPVAFEDRCSTAAEQNYSFRERDLLAIKEALQMWSFYVIDGYMTFVRTGHASL